ncbi:DUF2071 domain-containing protein [soil metagenome]
MLGVVSYPDFSPHVIHRPAVTQRWEDVTLLHWRVAPSAVQARLPEGLIADTIDGSGWVSLVPFRMVDLTVPPVPPLPLIDDFPETNIRTYVDGPAGPGIWFASLDIPRLAGVPVARLGFGQPYVWARMGVAHREPEIRYWSSRRYPGPWGARCHVGVRIGDRREPDDLDRWLVNRWGAYSVIRGRLCFAPVVHDPWPLHDAEVTVLHDELGMAAGWPLDRIERVHHTPSSGPVAFDWPRAV